MLVKYTDFVRHHFVNLKNKHISQNIAVNVGLFRIFFAEFSIHLYLASKSMK